MRTNLKQYNVTNVRLKCMDFLTTDSSQYTRVEYIMLDVPCSGSGMSTRLKFGDVELEQAEDASRLERLESLQRKMLLHAMCQFESVQRIVYSTCSVNKEENESVVRYALENCEQQFELVNLFEDSSSFGRGICEGEEDAKKHIEYCVRLNLVDNWTNGFFIACFQRREDTKIPIDE